MYHIDIQKKKRCKIRLHWSMFSVYVLHSDWWSLTGKHLLFLRVVLFFACLVEQLYIHPTEAQRAKTAKWILILFCQSYWNLIGRSSNTSHFLHPSCRFVWAGGMIGHVLFNIRACWNVLRPCGFFLDCCGPACIYTMKVWVTSQSASCTLHFVCEAAQGICALV